MHNIGIVRMDIYTWVIKGFGWHRDALAYISGIGSGNIRGVLNLTEISEEIYAFAWSLTHLCYVGKEAI